MNQPTNLAPSPSTDSPDATVEALPVTDDPMALLQTKIESLEAQVKEKETKYVYLYADFENFKKRSLKERSDLLKFGTETLTRDLLQVFDNLERAKSYTSTGTDKGLLDGLDMVLNQFKTTLERSGVQTLESHLKAFDPNFHEAIAQEKSEHPQGTIIKEEVKGYTLHGRLLRPAKVIVSQGN